jgi:hypothetical protein
MWRKLTALLLILGCGAGQLPPGAISGNRAMEWRNVDLIVERGGQSEDYDVRLILDPTAKLLAVTDEDNPTRTRHAEIPYSAIKSVSYSRSEHPRWKSGAGVAVAIGIFALPIFFMKGKKHWLTVTHVSADNPEGFLHLRLDKDNYQQIIAAMEAQTGLKVERIEEE